MKKAILALSAALAIGGILPGCGAGNAAYNNPNTPRNVTYRNNPNTAYPYQPENVNMDTNRQDRTNYPNERRLAKKIADRANTVKGVGSAYAVVSRNNVLVGAVPANTHANNSGLASKVRDAIKPLAGNRTVYVTTDNRYIQRIKTDAANFNAGKGTREVRSDIVGIIDDLSRALKRPFQNNSK